MTKTDMSLLRAESKVKGVLVAISAARHSETDRAYEIEFAIRKLKGAIVDLRKAQA